MSNRINNNYNIEPLNANNFHTWKFRMEMLLLEKGVNDMAKNAFNEDNYSEEREREKAKRKDNMCKNLIVQCLGDSQIDLVRGKKTAHDMWRCLEDMYEQKGLSGQLHLKRKLMSLKMKEGDDIESFLLKFDGVVHELKATGADIKEEDLACNLLMALPMSFQTIVTIIENMEPEKVTIEFIKTKLRTEIEKRRVSGDDIQDSSRPTAFVTSKNVTCFNCGEQGHIRKNCKVYWRSNQVENHHHQPHWSFTNTSNQRGASNHRFIRGSYGRGGNHRGSRGSYRAGYTRQGYRGRFGGNQAHYVKKHEVSGEGDNKESNSVKVSEVNDNDSIGETSVCFMGSTDIENKLFYESIMFYIDSGCTDHLVNDKNYFSSFKTLESPINIAVAKDGHYLQAVGIGNLNVLSNINNKQIKCNIQNVLYVPHLRKNLLSVKRLEMSNIKVVFENSQVKLYDKQNELIGIGHRNRLYEIAFKIVKTECLETCVNLEGKLWHDRLGHIGQTSLKRVMDSHMVNGITKINLSNIELCESCVKGKMSRLTFGSRTKAKSVLEIVHSDVCGPISPISYAGNKYFVTFIDDYSNFVCVYIIKEKSEVFTVFKEFVRMVRTKFNKNISVLRCDNGGEYRLENLKLFCKENGTVMDFTNPYTPQQNGKSERYNRTLVDKARTMMQHAQMPKQFWEEAIKTAAYLINRSPTSNPEKVTPAEIWYGRKPDISNLRVFGCIAYSHIPKELRNKFDAKAEKCIMLGYTNNGYRLWDIEKQKIKLSRDVIFNESVFYYKTFEPKEMVEIDINREYFSDDGDDDLKESENHRENADAENKRDRNKRVIKPPSRFDNFEMYMAFDAMSYVEDVPTNMEELNYAEDKEMWHEAMKREIQAIERNHTWYSVKPPNGAEILDTKWVFSRKPLEKDSKMKYKARLVVRGFAQRNNFNFEEIYSPVAKMATIRALLAIGNQFAYYFIQLDVKTAFLNARLKDDVYIHPPWGVKCKENEVLKLNKSLYGLKQAAKCWNDEINSFLMKLEFKRSEADCCLYSRYTEKGLVYLLLYVDDIIIAGPDLVTIGFFKRKLFCTFEMSEKGELSNFLGLEIQYDREKGRMKINQRRYLKSLLKRFGFEGCSTSAVPIDPGLKLDGNNQEKQIRCNKPVRELIGCLMYLMLGSRPDISFAVNYFSRFQDKSTDQIWNNMKRILRYLKGTENLSLVYTRNTNEIPLTCYVDADWGGDTHDRKSVSGYIIKVFGNTVQWVTRKQNCVALSTTEAELIALCSAVQDCIWLKRLLKDFYINIDTIKIFEDNRGCIFLVKNPENNRRVKHIDLKFHFVNEEIKAGSITIEYLNTKRQQADMLTKGLHKVRFYENCIDLGLYFDM